jgi:phage terminase large subunit GpA-like protein
VYPVYGRDENIAKGKNYKLTPSDYGAPGIIINDQHFKKAVYFYLGRESEQDDGFMHFPNDLAQSYFDGLTSEVMTEEVNKRTGKKSAKITNPKGRRNEPLDLYKMAYAALYFMCGEHYAAINRRNRAAKRQEVQVDIKAFIRMMDDSTRGGEE